MSKKISTRLKGLLIGIIILMLFINPISANDWTSFQENIQHTGFIEEAGDFVSNLWAINLESPIKSSPAIKEKTMYLTTEDGLLQAIDMENGDIKWEYQLDGKVTASPVIEGDNLFIGTGVNKYEGYMYNFNIKDEKVSWKFETSTPIKSTGFINENVLYFGTNDGRVYALDKDDGSKIWENDIGGKVKSSPTYVNGTVYVGSTNGIIFALNANDGRQIWNYTTGDEVLASPAYGDGKIFIGSVDGTLYALNTNDGNLVWKYDLGNKVISSASLDLRNNNLYIGSDSGKLTCLDTRDGTFKWSYETDGAIRSTPGIYDNKVVFGSNDGKAHILNKYTGESELTYNPGMYIFNSPISSSPVIYGKTVFLAGEDGFVYALDGEKLDTPISIFTYYTAAIVIAIFIILIALVIFIRKRK